jgi:hypothetical protein
MALINRSRLLCPTACRQFAATATDGEHKETTSGEGSSILEIKNAVNLCEENVK